jgi:hypothetical protein
MTSQDPLLHDPRVADDLELGRAVDELPPDPPKRPTGLLIAAAALIVVAAVGAYFLLRRTPPPAPVAAAPAAVEPPPALGGTPAPVVVPPLEDSDAFVRDLVKALSSHPAIAAWLTTDGLIRNFTVAVVNVAEGNTPAGDLKVLRPSGAFAVVERGEDVVIDPRSYQRYDALAAAAASVDAEGAARLFATLKPRIEEANGELGFSATPFDRTLERAIVLLLQTPVVTDPIRVEPHGIGYGFADPKLEDLAPAQKQLLRMGAKNARTVQAALRSIALALGIPATRLPPAPLVG